MPIVPNVPGVPSLSSYATGAIALLVSDAVSFALSAAIPRWGIFRNGVAVIASTNTISFEMRQDFPISDYPVEKGAFQSYNKVQLPGDIRVSVSRGGSETERQQFLKSIDAVINTTDLYDVVTPEQVYTNYNFSHRDVRRAAKGGVGLITVDLWLTEIRESSTASFQNTQQPGIAGQQGVGNMQATTPIPYIQNQVSSGAWVIR